MRYTSKELRNTDRALLRRVQRKLEKEQEEKSQQIPKQEFTPLWEDALGFSIEDSLIFPEAKKKTRLSLYKQRGGR